MIILNSIYNRLLLENADVPYETGGILGGRNGVVTTHFSDNGANIIKPCSYTPNVKVLNEVIYDWQHEDICFMGIYHTHFGSESLSLGDKSYIDEIVKAMPTEIEKLYFPIIVRPIHKIIVYVAQRNWESWELLMDTTKIICTEGGVNKK